MHLLIKLFIKNYKNVEEEETRTAYGTFAGIFGIVTNSFLAVIKIIMGSLIAHSAAIVADGVNNLSDSLSSIITLVGFKISSKKADKDHPFGHQRFEYVTGLFISIFILIIGFTIAKESVMGIILLLKGNAKPLASDNILLVIILLIVSILIKFWQAIFYKKISKTIDSEALVASSKDSLNDCITTITVLVSLIIFIISKGRINIDSIASLLVALFIIISGVGLIKDTMSPLLGEVASEEEVALISKKLESYEGVLGIHDLVIHNYGPNLNFATVHCEVSREVDVMKSHDLIDNIEREFRNKMGIDLTIHMDPIEVNDNLTDQIKQEVVRIIASYDETIHFHDFRIITGPTHTNILFDIVIPPNYKNSPNEVRKQICDLINAYNKTWFAVIQVDQFYTRVIDEK